MQARQQKSQALEGIVQILHKSNGSNLTLDNSQNSTEYASQDEAFSECSYNFLKGRIKKGRHPRKKPDSNETTPKKKPKDNEETPRKKKTEHKKWRPYKEMTEEEKRARNQETYKKYDRYLKMTIEERKEFNKKIAEKARQRRLQMSEEERKAKRKLQYAQRREKFLSSKTEEERKLYYKLKNERYQKQHKYGYYKMTEEERKVYNMEQAMKRRPKQAIINISDTTVRTPSESKNRPFCSDPSVQTTRVSPKLRIETTLNSQTQVNADPRAQIICNPDNLRPNLAQVLGPGPCGAPWIPNHSSFGPIDPRLDLQHQQPSLDPWAPLGFEAFNSDSQHHTTNATNLSHQPTHHRANFS